MTVEKGAADDLIFVVGSLRRDLSDAFEMENAEFVATGLSKGVLHDVGGSPCFVPEGGSGFVTGELYQTRDADKLLEVIRASDACAAGLNVEKDFRLARVKVHPDNLGQRAWEARTWEWIGEQGGRKVSPPDWTEWMRPRSAPWCTAIAAICLFNASFGLLAGITGVFPPAGMPRLPGHVLGTMILLSAPAGLFAVWLGRRRRERWQEPRQILHALLGLLFFPILLILIGLLVGLVADSP